MSTLVDISLVVLKKKISKLDKCTFFILLLSPLEQGHGPLFEQTLITFTQDCFVQSLVEIGLVILERIKDALC